MLYVLAHVKYWRACSMFFSVSTGWPKRVSHYQIIKKCVKSYLSLTMRLDFFVKLKKWSSTIILSVSIKYSLRDLLFDAKLTLIATL